MFICIFRSISIPRTRGWSFCDLKIKCNEVYFTTFSCTGSRSVQFLSSRFERDIEYMLNDRPGIYWKVCWKFIAPVFIIVVFLASLIKMMVNGIGYQRWDIAKVKTIRVSGSGFTTELTQQKAQWFAIEMKLLISVLTKSTPPPRWILAVLNVVREWRPLLGSRTKGNTFRWVTTRQCFAIRCAKI